MMGHNQTFDPRNLAEQLLNYAQDYADKNAASELLTETKKTIRAQIATKHLADGMPVSKAELLAEASPEYGSHIKEMVKANRAANLAKAQLDAYRAYIDLVRSQESSRRAEMAMR